MRSRRDGARLPRRPERLPEHNPGTGRRVATCRPGKRAAVTDSSPSDELYLRLQREHDHLRRVQELLCRLEGQDAQALRWIFAEYLRMAAILLDD